MDEEDAQPLADATLRLLADAPLRARLGTAGRALVQRAFSLEAQAELARTLLARTERMAERRAASQVELEQARAERDVALAQIARTKAIIARKTIRAPFRARIGMSDVHTGQFLETGRELTTLQGVDEAANVEGGEAPAHG